MKLSDIIKYLCNAAQYKIYIVVNKQVLFELSSSLSCYTNNQILNLINFDKVLDGIMKFLSENESDVKIARDYYSRLTYIVKYFKDDINISQGLASIKDELKRLEIKTNEILSLNEDDRIELSNKIINENPDQYREFELQIQHFQKFCKLKNDENESKPGILEIGAIVAGLIFPQLRIGTSLILLVRNFINTNISRNISEMTKEAK